MFDSRNFRIFVLAGFSLTAGCAMQHYQPAPINPAASASVLESRSLTDPGLREFLQKNLGHEISPWPAKQWDLSMITLAAFYFSPVLEEARDRVLAAQASEVTAGARPNPSLSVSPGVPSPYLFSLDLNLPLETAGKRGERIAIARNLTDAARFDLANRAWIVRGNVRTALLNLLLAFQQLDLLRSQEEILKEDVQLLDQRISAGEIPQPDADFARIQLEKNRISIQAAEGRTATARAALAATIGMTVAGLGDADFLWPNLDSPPRAESLTPTEIQRDAVVNRLDVRRALSQYAAAEAELQLEIAKQYPDINIGPGYAYEETNSFFTLGVSAALPVFNRNRGPIAEAEARRKEAAAAFVSIQEQVIAQSEEALAGYRSAYAEFSTASESLGNLQQTQQKMTEQAVSAGEMDQLALIGVELEGAAVAQARLDALAHAQMALGALENAVQRPLLPGEMTPPGAMFSRPPKRGGGSQ
jgi:outer membrane protein, heavy metal efflux system